MSWYHSSHNPSKYQNRKLEICHAARLTLQKYLLIYLAAIFIGKVKVKVSLYRPGLAQRMGRGIALLFHDRGTRRGWVVSSTPWPYFTPGKDPVAILQESGWAPGPVWTGGKSRPHRDSIPGRPARSQSLYRLSYTAHDIYRYKQLINSNPIYTAVI